MTKEQFAMNILQEIVWEMREAYKDRHSDEFQLASSFVAKRWKKLKDDYQQTTEGE